MNNLILYNYLYKLPHNNISMAIPKKTLPLFPEPDAREYSCGGSKMSGLSYKEKSKKLINALGLRDDIREVLIIDLNRYNYAKTLEEKPEHYLENYDIRKYPYNISTTMFEENVHGTFYDPLDKNGLLEIIDGYIEENMDNPTLAIVYPSLVDLISSLLKDRYETPIIEINAEKVPASKGSGAGVGG